MKNSPTSVHFSTGTTRYDNVPTQRVVTCFDEFEKYIFANRSQRKGQSYFCGPLAAGPHDDPVKYPGIDHYRLARNALPRSFLATDEDWYSDANAFHDLFEFFKQFRGFGYTTRKHQDNAPRTRSVFELDRPVDRDEGKVLGAALGAFIHSNIGEGRVKLDDTVYRNEQPIFLPGTQAEAFHFDGKPVDVDQILLSFGSAQAKAASIKSKRKKNAPSNGKLWVSKDVVPTSYSKLTPHSIEMVLGSISCDNEPDWFKVACALARAYGESGRIYFERFSRGDYRGTPYPTFDQLEVYAEYDRALRELAIRPTGYGVRHLIRMAGLKHQDVDFDDVPMAQAAPASVPLQLPFIRNNRPLQIAENLKTVLDHHRVVVRYNQIAKDCEVLIPGFACVADESSNASMAKVTDLAIKAGMTSARVPEIVFSMAAQNVYCPVQTYISSKVWDGSSRFNQFVGQLVISRSKFAQFLVRKWLIQAIAAAYKPNGIANAGVIVLTGPQAEGKTRIFKDLTSGVPRAFLEGATLDPANRDSVMAVVRHWIVELGEIDATFKRSDLAQLKAFITRQEDVLRRPYAPRESSYPRRTVFAGTVNDYGFLHDLTGNRRFWPIEVQSISRDPTIDYQQLWAEVKTWYDAGETWYLERREVNALAHYSERFLVLDPVVEALLERYDFQNATAWDALLMSEICNKIGIFHPTKAQQMQLASAIKKYNGNQPPRVISGLKRHVVPA